MGRKKKQRPIRPYPDASDELPERTKKAILGHIKRGEALSLHKLTRGNTVYASDLQYALEQGDFAALRFAIEHGATIKGQLLGYMKGGREKWFRFTVGGYRNQRQFEMMYWEQFRDAFYKGGKRK